jgi:peptidoglycan/xylan/chitin deacetylase (PgdA/CDA1 family)
MELPTSEMVAYRGLQILGFPLNYRPRQNLSPQLLYHHFQQRFVNHIRRHKSDTMPKRILCSYGVDIDAVAGWLGSYGGEDSASDISRGLWAGSHGTKRMLKLFNKYNIKATWFIPGHTLETFPEECAMVRDAGHEIGLHGMHASLDSPVVSSRADRS